MANLDDVISLIENNIVEFINVAEALNDDNQKLKQQVETLSRQLSEKDDEVRVLESKYQSLMLTKTLSSSTKDVDKVKQQMSRMVREIDKCIALLNK